MPTGDLDLHVLTPEPSLPTDDPLFKPCAICQAPLGSDDTPVAESSENANLCPSCRDYRFTLSRSSESMSRYSLADPLPVPARPETDRTSDSARRLSRRTTSNTNISTNTSTNTNINISTSVISHVPSNANVSLVRPAQGQSGVDVGINLSVIGDTVLSASHRPDYEMTNEDQEHSQDKIGNSRCRPFSVPVPVPGLEDDDSDSDSLPISISPPGQTTVTGPDGRIDDALSPTFTFPPPSPPRFVSPPSSPGYSDGYTLSTWSPPYTQPQPHSHSHASHNVVEEDDGYPDPLADITRLRVRSKGHRCLFPGAVFQGSQKSGRSSYDVTVTIVDVDFDSSFLCGYLRIRGLTEDWPELTTYFDAQIIGLRHGFLTQDWGATKQEDMMHWARFPAFRAVKKELVEPGLMLPENESRSAVFMRWKERFLVPDHRVQDISGASFAGFYYVCVDFDPDAHQHTAQAQARARAQSRSQSAHHTYPRSHSQHQRAYASQSPATHPDDPSLLCTDDIFPAQQYCPLPMPQLPAFPGPATITTASTATVAQRSGLTPIPSPTSINTSPSSTAMSPGSYDLAFEDEDELDIPDVTASANATMTGFYYHQNSEPYQQLTLTHVPERFHSSFEFR